MVSGAKRVPLPPARMIPRRSTRWLAVPAPFQHGDLFPTIDDCGSVQRIRGSCLIPYVHLPPCWPSAPSMRCVCSRGHHYLRGVASIVSKPPYRCQSTANAVFGCSIVLRSQSCHLERGLAGKGPCREALVEELLWHDFVTRLILYRVRYLSLSGLQVHRLPLCPCSWMRSVHGKLLILQQSRRLSPAPAHCCFSSHGVSTSVWPQAETVGLVC